MNQVIELPIWFIFLAAVGCYLLGMIAEVAAQTKSMKERKAEEKKARATMFLLLGGVLFFWYMVVRPVFKKKEKVEPPADGPDGPVDSFIDMMK